MNQAYHICISALLLAALTLTGCGIRQHRLQYESAMSRFDGLVEAARDSGPVVETLDPVEAVYRPITIDGEPRKPLPLSLEDAVAAALVNSKVLRELGGRLIQSPQTARTIMDPAIVETDPLTGVEGALSAFDTQFASSLFFENNDRAVNNVFESQGVNIFTQDLGTYQAEFEKTSATGTQFTLGQTTTYDLNNSPQNIFDGAWTAQVLAEVRQPLLQGRGVAFNRVAGPNGTPNNLQGVVIARLNTDISQLDFEVAVRDLVNNIENAYWDLYFAYRLLDSRIAARDASLKIWNKVKAQEWQAKPGQLEQASEQYWRFEEEVIAARTGRVIDGTRSNNGSTGGTFNGNIGVHVAERRLRLLIGWPINDEWQIRPDKDPEIAEVDFDWDTLVYEAISNRSEVRRQALLVKRSGLQVAATHNFLLPRFDVVGGYRFRGLGDNLIKSGRDGRDRFDNAWMNLTSGDFQEWYLGAETALPVGFRQAHSALRNARLQQSREQAILDEIKRQVVHDLSNAYANLERAYRLTKVNFNRRVEAHKRLEILRSSEATLGVDIDSLLDAERRAADADSHFFQSLVDYVVAIKNVHLEKGSLLTYNKVYLSDVAPSDQRSGPAQQASPEMPRIGETEYGLPPATDVPGAELTPESELPPSSAPSATDRNLSPDDEPLRNDRVTSALEQLRQAGDDRSAGIETGAEAEGSGTAEERVVKREDEDRAFVPDAPFVPDSPPPSTGTFDDAEAAETAPNSQAASGALL